MKLVKFDMRAEEENRNIKQSDNLSRTHSSRKYIEITQVSS